MTTSPLNKGYAAEEALRRYFTNLGYFVVRSVPFNYKTFEVTDIDLWLYIKSSPLARERTCVDVKRRKTPQAMERVLWTRGLRELIRVERATIVTTDNRIETQELGSAHGVEVLNRDFLEKAMGSLTQGNRITEDELFGLLKAPCVVDRAIVWVKWFRSIKTALVDDLSYNGCNRFLSAIGLLLQEYIATAKSFHPTVRLLYIVVAYLLIAIDYVSCSMVHSEEHDRRKKLTDGFRYGEAGKERTEEIVNMALYLLAEAGKANMFSEKHLKEEFSRQLSEYPAELLAEHFAKIEPLNNLFRLAREFENAAYATNLILPHNAPSEHKGLIGLLCDFLKINRRDII